MATHATDPAFLKTALQIVDLMLVHPRSPLQTAVGGGALLLALGFLYPKIGTAFDGKNVSAIKGWLLAVLTPGLLVGAATATQIYVLPSVIGATVQNIVLASAVVLAYLLVVVPLTKLLFTFPYVAGLLSSFFTMICGAVAVLVVHMGFDAIATGERTAGAIQDRSKSIKEQGVQ